MLSEVGHEMLKANGGSREPKATNKHNNWKAGVAALNGQSHKDRDDRPAAKKE